MDRNEAKTFIDDYLKDRESISRNTTIYPGRKPTFGELLARAVRAREAYIEELERKLNNDTPDESC